MPQSWSRVWVHLVFATKHRQPWLDAAWRDDLHGYLGGVVRHHQGVLLAIGSATDHVHLLVELPRTITLADLVRQLKTASTAWIQRRGGAPAEFRWQAGYAVFSVDPTHCERLAEYVRTQESHHAERSFEDEYRALLAQHSVTYDERYVWD